jgi:glutathione S-transferase
MGFSWLPSFFRPLQRTPAHQQRVEEKSRQLALYHFPACAYCLRVRRFVWRLNLPLELRNVARQPTWARELREKGGKLQVPCLQIRHPDHTEWLYESDDIISYLKVHFSR